MSKKILYLMVIKYSVTVEKRKEKISPQDLAVMYQEYGAVGELIINSIHLDGNGMGYDISLIKSIAQSIDIPLIISGGAGGLHDFKAAIDAGASAVSAGDFFVYEGQHKAVLVSYPDYDHTFKLLNE